MKQYLCTGVLLLLLTWLHTACNDETDLVDQDVVIDSKDTTSTDTQDSLICDTLTYEDAPIWLGGEQEYGFARGLKNGQAFEASAFAIVFNPPKDSLGGVLFYTYTQEKYVRDIFVVGNFLISRTDKYNLSFDSKTIAYANYDTSQDGGDVAGDRYTLDSLFAKNKLEILEIDTARDIVRGVFTAAFNIDKPDAKKDPRNPNYCILEEVYFESQFSR